MSGTGPKRTKRSLLKDLGVYRDERNTLKATVARLKREHAETCDKLRSDLYELRETHARTLAALAQVTRALYDAEADRDGWQVECGKRTDECTTLAEELGEARIRQRFVERYLTTAQVADVERKMTLALNAGPEAA